MTLANVFLSLAAFGGGFILVVLAVNIIGYFAGASCDDPGHFVKDTN